MNRHFLGWDKALPEAAATWLLGQADGRMRDLSAMLVLVPTRESGRLLRMHLARTAQRENCAVLPPRLMTPQAFIAEQCGNAPLATVTESLWAWHSVLTESNLGSFPTLFPQPPSQVDSAWSRGFAERVEILKATLAEEAITLADVPKRLDLIPTEHSRWRDLIELDTRYRNKLSASNLIDRHHHRIQNLDTITNVFPFSEVVLMAVPDPLPLALKAIERLSCKRTVVIYAPESLSEAFDHWGRPEATYWEEADLGLHTAQTCVHTEPADMAKALADCIRQTKDPMETLTLGLGDVGWREPFVHALGMESVAVRDPEGVSATKSGFVNLLRTILRAATTGHMAAMRALACQPLVRDWLAHSDEFGDLGALLREADELHHRHLVLTVEDCLDAKRRGITTGKHWQEAVARLWELCERWLQAPLADSALAVMQEFCRGETLDVSQAIGSHEAALVEQWLAQLERVDALQCEQVTFESGAMHEWMLAELSQARLYPEAEGENIVLKGWLELLWDDAPALELAGIHEGGVPQSIGADPFLPGSAREMLGLRSNAMRYAQDAYMLATLVASRSKRGAVRIHHCQVNFQREPVKPSRLLFHVDDTQLAERVTELLQEPPRHTQSPAPTTSWWLDPPEANMPSRFSPSAFRTFLQDPYAFYLRHVLRLEPFDSNQCELDNGQFGELCHQALADLGVEKSLSDCTDEKVLRDFVRQRFSDKMAYRYGRSRTVPLIIQERAAHQRLGRVAAILAGERQAGWRVLEQDGIEWKFEDGHALQLAGSMVVGQIDRIERHEEDGRLRVLDFKTGEKAGLPEASHIAGSRTKRPPHGRDYFYLPDGKRIWKDLQLPLYAAAAQARYAEPIQTAYILMPKALEETRLAGWSIDEATQASALRCACGIIEDVRAGRYFPCADYSSRFESFSERLEQSLREALNPTFRQAHGEEVADA